MKNWKKSVLYWIMAIFFAVLIMIFQRMTGPTHPVKANETIKGEKVFYKFLRSSTALKPLKVSINVKNKNLDGYLYSKRYDRVNKYEWDIKKMERSEDILSGEIKGEDIAGKVEYLIKLITRDTKEEFHLNEGKSVIARFKGAVPLVYLLSHIIFMILGFIFAMRTLLETFRKDGNYFNLVNWTLGIVFLGGMILGPIVQYYAFNDLWTGIPFGTDLTDNKTLIAFIFWVIAFFLKKKSKFWVILAVLIMLIVYSIPHSAFGSERNYKTGTMNNKYSKVQLDFKKDKKSEKLKFLT